jgi:predicted alpha/beta-hydrolase family hydrolase
MSDSARWRVVVDGEATTALFEPATTQTNAVFVCAHGAGGHMDHRGMQRLAAVLRAGGFDVVRFNFLYREKGASRPDAMPRLQACMTAVIERARTACDGVPLVIGGRSMGGRAASMLAADGLACDGLLLLAYPLHPAGKPEQLRDSHLPRIRVPVLCLNGTRDPLCQRELMERALAAVQTPWEMHWLEGADHSFRVLKRSGRTDADVLEEIGDASERWRAGLPHEQPLNSLPDRD